MCKQIMQGRHYHAWEQVYLSLLPFQQGSRGKWQRRRSIKEDDFSTRGCIHETNQFYYCEKFSWKSERLCFMEK